MACCEPDEPENPCEPLELGREPADPPRDGDDVSGPEASSGVSEPVNREPDVCCGRTEPTVLHPAVVPSPAAQPPPSAALEDFLAVFWR